MSLRTCVVQVCEESSRVETAWTMAEIKPYSFESMRNSWESEEDDVHKSQDER